MILKTFVRTIRKRITQALFFEIEFTRIQRGFDLPLRTPRRMFRAAHRRAKVVLKANLHPSGLRRSVESAVEGSIEQIPLAGPRTIARTVRDHAFKAIEASLATLPEVERELEGALHETLEKMPMERPTQLVRRVHRRARVVVKANLQLSHMQRRLVGVVDETIEQIPLHTPREMAKIARRKAAGVLETQVGLAELQRGLGRTIHKTLQGMPLDPGLLIKQGTERSRFLNRQLAWSLAFVAGAVNAGGFLAAQSYTSHVTGVVSRVANEIVLGNKGPALIALGVIVCFFAGAFCAGLLISLGRRHRFQAHYALSLMVEAALLLVFGIMGVRLHAMGKAFVPATIALLSFVMGMHNSVVTTISNAEVRTTHLTGILTDMGVEFSRLFYFNVDKDEDERMGRIMANRNKLKLHSLILVSFFVGGLAGAVGFQTVGFKMTIFLAIFLILLAWRPVLEDIKIRFRVVREAV